MGIFDKFKKIFKEEKELDKYDEGLKKTRNEFVSKLGNLSSKYKNISEDYFNDLEEILIMADLGVDMVFSFVENLKRRVKNEDIKDTNDLKEIIVDELFIMYVNDSILDYKIKENKEGPTVLLFVGVNGVGKTTSIGKLAYKLTKNNKKVLLVAADTFRAGASPQLLEWSKRSNSEIIFNEEKKDPSSLVFDGLTYGVNNNYDYILIDTAGRLQNKEDLMRELSKMNKVISSFIPTAPHETLLVIDATTGQNGISQAKSFSEITNITGIVLTKLDGSAKGGIVLSIKKETNIPVKYVGLGEKIDDLEVFDIEKYVYGLFKELM